MTLFEGAGVALAAPFKKNGEVNYEKPGEIVEEQIMGGTDAIITCDTTGEASTMTHEEHLDVIEYICRMTKRRTPMVVGTGSNCAEIAVCPSAEAEKRGADGFLLVSLYHNKVTQKGLMIHFTVVADVVKIPVALYNIPGRTSIVTRPETIAALCKGVGNIVGAREAIGDFSVIATLMSLSDGKVNLYSGNDDQIVPLLFLGGKGVISVLSSVAPHQTHDIYVSYFVGDIKTSVSLQLKTVPLIAEPFGETNPIPIEVTMDMVDKSVGPLCIPLIEMESQNQEKLKKATADYGILQGRFRERAVYQW